MKLICDFPSPKSLPDKYVLPPEKRPCNHELRGDLSVALPVIDLQGALGDGRRQVIGEIMEAGKEFGFFQAVNHGVGEDVIQGFREAAAEFFRMPAEAKLKHYSNERNKHCRVFSGSVTSHTDTNDILRYWRDCLKLRCYPVDKLMHHWPSQPETFRERLAKYAVAVQELAQRLLRLIAEGLGLDSRFFEGDLTGGETMMNVNYYPRCPDPSLTLGIRPHSDRYILTVLSQGDVSGLQVKHKGRWIGVQPMRNAFVVNFGLQLEMVTNGVLTSVEHRVVTNAAKARMSVATLIRPNMGCRIGPAPVMVNGETNYHPKYRDFTGSELIEAYEATAGNREALLEMFRIHHTK